jgi:hypothetical protein
MISGDRNVINEETEKILNCKRLTTEAGRTNVITAILVTIGTISTSFRKYLSNVTGKHDIK